MDISKILNLVVQEDKKSVEKLLKDPNTTHRVDKWRCLGCNKYCITLCIIDYERTITCPHCGGKYTIKVYKKR